MAHISALYIYPVKSLGGIAVSQARTTDRGFEFDRRWMIVDDDDEFVTQREVPKMATVWVAVDAAALSLSAEGMDELVLPHGEHTGQQHRVTVWNSSVSADEVSQTANQWLSDYLGQALRLVHMPDASLRACNAARAPGKHVSFADGYPYLVTNEASLADLNQRIAARRVDRGAPPTAPIPMSRFRPNIVVAGWDAWAEDTIGSFTAGDARFDCVKPCGRCQITTTDQATGEVKGPEPLATLATFRDSNEYGVMFGQNAVAFGVGYDITVGQAIG